MGKLAHKKKKISKDCWNLDQAFFIWLHEHLVVYLKEAGENVDLSYYKFDYKGKKYTQEEIIKMMINDLKDIHYLGVWNPKYQDLSNEILDLWKLVFHAMWW